MHKTVADPMRTNYFGYIGIFNSNYAHIIVGGMLRSFCADLGPGEALITWPILNGFPNFKDQQTHNAPDVLLVLSLKKLTIPRQS